MVEKINEPVHEISNNVVCATSKASDQPAHMRSLIRALSHEIFCLVVLHLPYASYAYKNYWLCDRCDRDFMLKKSAAINDVKT